VFVPVCAVSQWVCELWDLVRKLNLHVSLISPCAKVAAFFLLSSESSLPPPHLFLSPVVQCGSTFVDVVSMRPAVWNKLTLYSQRSPHLVYPPWKNVITFVFENTTDLCVYLLWKLSLWKWSGAKQLTLGEHCREERDHTEIQGTKQIVLTSAEVLWRKLGTKR
jgi:hypothetical protein